MSTTNLTNREFMDRFDEATALEDSQSAAKTHNSTHMFTALLFAVFVLVLLVSITAATRVFDGLHTIQMSANEARLGEGLIANMVHANDEINSVAVGQGPEGRSLVLREVLESGTYETRIYLYEGNILEEYVLEGTAYSPKTATNIVASSTFEFSYENGMLTITTDQGTTKVALRSLAGGGA